jgi:hypothetical protein
MRSLLGPDSSFSRVGPSISRSTPLIGGGQEKGSVMTNKEELPEQPLPKRGNEAAKHVVVPLRERCWISVREAHQVAGEGRTKFYSRLRENRIVTKKVGRRRLVSVASLLEYCGP